MMSHKQIAELVNARPDSVKRTIDRLADRGVINVTPLVEDTGYKNQTAEVYYLNEDDSITVAAQVMPELTAGLVKEWRRLTEENHGVAARLGGYYVYTNGGNLRCVRCHDQEFISFTPMEGNPTGSSGGRPIAILLKVWKMLDTTTNN